MIISKTPFRISFFGGGTDYPLWYREHGGAVLSTTFDKYCYVTCRGLPPFFDHKHRITYSRVEDVTQIADIQHPAIRAVLSEMSVDDGLEIHCDADLPARSGIGSSSSFVVGLLNSLSAIRGRIQTKEWLAHEAIRIEQGVLKESVGSQDQVAAAYGGFNQIDFDPTGRISVNPVNLPQVRKTELNRHLMLFFTGFSRLSSEVAETKIKNLSRRKSELFEMKSMVSEGRSILESNSDIVDFGKLLHETWQRKRNLSNRVSTDAIDEIYDVARRSGAVGGKLLGAGGGGFMLIFAQPEKHASIRTALSSLVFVPFEFESKGAQLVSLKELHSS